MYFFERTLLSRDYHYILLAGDLTNDKAMKGEYFIGAMDPFEFAWPSRTKIAEIKIIINISTFDIYIELLLHKTFKSILFFFNICYQSSIKNMLSIMKIKRLKLNQNQN